MTGAEAEAGTASRAGALGSASWGSRLLDLVLVPGERCSGTLSSLWSRVGFGRVLLLRTCQGPGSADPGVAALAAGPLWPSVVWLSARSLVEMGHTSPSTDCSSPTRAELSESRREKGHRRRLG